jgi:hypothetical protein
MASMPTKPLKSLPKSDPSILPEFDRAMRAIVRAPKPAVELSIQRERERKAKKSRRK